MEVPGYTKSFSMDQGRILSNDQMFHALYNAPLTDPKRQGICCGLSIVWAARRMMFHKENAEQRRTGLVSMGGFRFGGRTQDIMMAAPDVEGGTEELYRGWFNPALEPYALRIVPGTVLHNPRPVDIAKLVAASRRSRAYCLYNIGLRTPGGSAAHMVASYTSKGTFGMLSNFYFFDPNMGEYIVDDDDNVPDFMRQVALAYIDAFGGLTSFDVFEIERG